MSGKGVEGAIFSALQELGKVFGENRVWNAAGQVVQSAAQTKQAIDDNVSSVLGLAGLPSKGDLDQLRRQLDVMQVTLANLSRKVDRLLEEAAADDPPPSRRRRRPPTSD
jgi:hypothetical protein